MMRDLPALLCATVAAVAAAALGCRAMTEPSPLPLERASGHVEAWLDSHRDQPPMVRAFVQRMPKGGDLHNHLSGAVYAEAYVKWGAAANYSLDPATNALIPPGSHAPGMIRLRDVLEDATAYSKLIDHLSTRNLAYDGQSGHDQFFQTFGEFGSVSWNHGADMIARLASRAADEHIQYLELMVTVHSESMDAALKADTSGLREALGAAGSSTPPAQPDFAKALGRLDQLGLSQWIEEGRASLETMSRSARSKLEQGDRGRDVHIRYLQQSNRVLEPEQVFAQLAFAFALAEADPRVVGINLVAPEDNRVALRDYTLHMQMVRFLGTRHPGVGVALHAGELTLGLVPPSDLRFHIRQAVEIAGARRIGHGVDVFYEDRAFELLEHMRDDRIAVEICLTSNDVILGVEGRNHPFLHYRAAGVPAVLASDDAGVSRIDLSNEYLRAVRDYGLGYEDLKELSRNSLEYSFIPGESLWETTSPFTMVEACAGDEPGADACTPACRAFLDASERAAQQWRLEAAFVEFERLPWLQPSAD